MLTQLSRQVRHASSHPAVLSKLDHTAPNSYQEPDTSPWAPLTGAVSHRHRQAAVYARIGIAQSHTKGKLHTFLSPLPVCECFRTGTAVGERSLGPPTAGAGTPITFRQPLSAAGAAWRQGSIASSRRHSFMSAGAAARERVIDACALVRGAKIAKKSRQIWYKVTEMLNMWPISARGKWLFCLWWCAPHY